MFREDEFRISRRPYAVDLSTVTWKTIGTSNHGQVTAVWYRRRNGLTVACIGTLWDFQKDPTDNARDFLARHADGRYGGNCAGRWDGQRYWGAQEPEVMEQHLALLRPMLAAYPTVMPGFDGWWQF